MNAQQAALSSLAAAAAIHRGEVTMPTEQEIDFAADHDARVRYLNMRRPRANVSSQGYPHSYVPESVPDLLFYELLAERDAAWAFGLASRWPRGRWERYGTAHTQDASDGDMAEGERYEIVPAGEWTDPMLDRLAEVVLNPCTTCGGAGEVDLPPYSDAWTKPCPDCAGDVPATTLDAALELLDVATAADADDDAQQAATANLERWAPDADTGFMDRVPPVAETGAFDVFTALRGREAS